MENKNGNTRETSVEDVSQNSEKLGSERARNLGAKTLGQVQRPAIMALATKQFQAIYPEAEIARDEAYVERTQQRFGEQQKSWVNVMAKKFETMFLYGIQTGRWLGNVLDEKHHADFQTEVSETTLYDDYRNRIDAFTNLTFAEPIESEQYEASLTKMVMGFDVTVSASRQTINEKLTRCSNDNRAELPFGFSQLKYYRSGKVGGKSPLVPRYVLGVSPYRVHELEQMAAKNVVDGRIVNMRFNPGQSAEVRFMVLSEMRAQNRLYRTMLPDEIDTPKLRQADLTLEVAEIIIDNAMDYCMRRLPWWNNIQHINGGDERRDAATEQMMQIAHQREVEYRKEESIRQSGYSFDEPDTKQLSTYEQIINCTRSLQKAADRGDLDEQRSVKAHNFAF